MNEYLIYYLCGLLFVSAAVNAFLLYKYLQKPKANIQETYDVQELLADLLAGQALIKIERIAPSNILLRSPRSRS